MSLKDNIKTAEQLINDAYFDKFKDINNYNNFTFGENELIALMKIYAEQFIDLAAEEAILAWNNTPHKKGYPYFCWNPSGNEKHGDLCTTVDRNSILKVKQLIK